MNFGMIRLDRLVSMESVYAGKDVVQCDFFRVGTGVGRQVKLLPLYRSLQTSNVRIYGIWQIILSKNRVVGIGDC